MASPCLGQHGFGGRPDLAGPRLGKSVNFWAAIFLHLCAFIGTHRDTAARWRLPGEMFVCLLSKVVPVADHNWGILAVLWDTWTDGNEVHGGLEGHCWPCSSSSRRYPAQVTVAGVRCGNLRARCLIHV